MIFRRIMQNVFGAFYLNGGIPARCIHSAAAPANNACSSCENYKRISHNYSTQIKSTGPTFSGLSSNSAVVQRPNTSHKFSTSSSVEIEEDDLKDLVNVINSQIAHDDFGRLFAVVQIGGHQRKITTDDIIVLQKHITADIGERIRINKVLLVGSQDFTLVGKPILDANLARVEATVLEKTLSHSQIMFWYHRRKNHRVFRMKKHPYTFLRINSIDINTVTEPT